MPQAITAKTAKKEAPFLLRDAGTQGPSSASGAPPAFPPDIIIATNPLLNRGSAAATLTLPPPSPSKGKRGVSSKSAVTIAVPKGRKRKTSAKRAPAPPAAAIEPIRPVAPARPAPTPLRPQQPGQQPGRASPQRPRRDGQYARVQDRQDGSRIAALDLRPQSDGAIAPTSISPKIQQSSAPKRSHSAQMDGAVALSRNTPAAAAPKHSPVPDDGLRSATIEALPRGAAIQLWQRNGFIDVIGYWLRGAQRRMLAWLDTPAVKPAVPATQPKKSGRPTMRTHSQDAEIRALRAENEHLRQQIRLLLARAAR